MNQAIDLRNIIGCLNCIGAFETNPYFMYQSLSDKADLPLINGLLQSIAQDNLKHSKLLKAITDSITINGEKNKDCAKETGQVWGATDTFCKQLLLGARITEPQLSQMAEKLETLETSFSKEYRMLIQKNTMEPLANEISGLYKVTPEKIKNIFTTMINDCDNHKEELQTIRELLGQIESKEPHSAPVVRYSNPDSWARSSS